MAAQEVVGSALPATLSEPKKPFPRIPGFNWKLNSVTNPSGSGLWFSDGQDLYAIRGGDGVSSRLIVGGQGFLDFTSFIFPTILGVDLNGATIFAIIKGDRRPKLPSVTLAIDLRVQNGRFQATARIVLDAKDSPPSLNVSDFLGSLQTHQKSSDLTGDPVLVITVHGPLKPLPQISDEDAKYLDTLIAQKYVPYQNIPGGGKPDELIRKLGKRFFPFTDHNYELAISTYDWTSASFARLVFMKVFQYTSMFGSPLCKEDIANMIWQSNWNSYKPSDKYYMMSFMMQPASSLDEVKSQLDNVVVELRKFSDTENRLLASAMAAMPRTSYISKPQLYSGQVDIFQFTVNRFGVEFLECPINAGPIGDKMTWDFQNALDTFVAAGKIITTKMVWSFTDSYQDALHYSNGIVLVANAAPRVPGTESPFNIHSFVWDTASFITDLSDEEGKIEYTFPPGSQFKVLNWFKNNTGIVVINLQVYEPSKVESTATDLEANIAPELPWSWHLPLATSNEQDALYDDSRERKAREKANELRGQVQPDALLHASIVHNNHGRWCRCVQAVSDVLA